MEDNIEPQYFSFRKIIGKITSQKILDAVRKNYTVEGSSDELVLKYAHLVGAVASGTNFIGTCFQIAPRHVITNLHVVQASEKVRRHLKYALHCMEEILDSPRPRGSVSGCLKRWIEQGLVTLGTPCVSQAECLSLCATNDDSVTKAFNDDIWYNRIPEHYSEWQTLFFNMRYLALFCCRPIILFYKEKNLVFLPSDKEAPKAAPLMMFIEFERQVEKRQKFPATTKMYKFARAKHYQYAKYTYRASIPVFATEEHPPDWETLLFDYNTSIYGSSKIKKEVLERYFQMEYRLDQGDETQLNPFPWKAVFDNSFASNAANQVSLGLTEPYDNLVENRKELLHIFDDVDMPRFRIKDLDVALLQITGAGSTHTSYLIPYAVRELKREKVLVIGFCGLPNKASLGHFQSKINEAAWKDLKNMCHPLKKIYGYGLASFYKLREKYPLPTHGHHSVTTLRGNSGSIVLEATSGRWIGIPDNEATVDDLDALRQYLEVIDNEKCDIYKHLELSKVLQQVNAAIIRRLKSSFSKKSRNRRNRRRTM